MLSETVIISPKFCGPPVSANGGYTAGLLAGLVGGPCEVTLRAPPPLEVPLDLALSPTGGAVLRQDATLIAEAESRAFELELPEPVSWKEAVAASQRFIGFDKHPYPSCFVCGTTRAPGDGLRIFPGRVEGRKVAAAPWRPTVDLCTDDVVEARFVWAALDCPSWFGFASFADDVPPILLGRMTATLQRRPELEERCVIVGWSLGREGRRIECGSMLLGKDGEAIAHAKATWITLKPSS
jgi:hypothetical protein